MKKLMAVLMVMCLAGCITATAKAPTGCENSFIWQSGFMPQGQDLVELGLAVLLTAEPQTIPQVKAGALKGWRLVREGTLKGAVAELLAVLKQHPQYAPLAMFALQRLDLEKTLDKCDQEVLLSMFHNIGMYAGAEEQDFSSSLANLTSPPQ
jgi:hypothetical protein